MHLVLTPNNIDPTNIYYYDAIKNTIIDNSMFIRISYSTDIMSLNGIFLSIPIESANIEYYYNKYRCKFDTKSYENIQQIMYICNIENIILQQVSAKINKHKMPQYKIKEQLTSGVIKTAVNSTISDHHRTKYNNSMYINIKISGIWETETQYGITYKFSCTI